MTDSKEFEPYLNRQVVGHFEITTFPEGTEILLTTDPESEAARARVGKIATSMARKAHRRERMEGFAKRHPNFIANAALKAYMVGRSPRLEAEHHPEWLRQEDRKGGREAGKRILIRNEKYRFNPHNLPEAVTHERGVVPTEEFIETLSLLQRDSKRILWFQKSINPAAVVDAVLADQPDDEARLDFLQAAHPVLCEIADAQDPDKRLNKTADPTRLLTGLANLTAIFLQRRTLATDHALAQAGPDFDTQRRILSDAPAAGLERYRLTQFSGQEPVAEPYLSQVERHGDHIVTTNSDGDFLVRAAPKSQMLVQAEFARRRTLTAPEAVFHSGLGAAAMIGGELAQQMQEWRNASAEEVIENFRAVPSIIVDGFPWSTNTESLEGVIDSMLRELQFLPTDDDGQAFREKYGWQGINPAAAFRAAYQELPADARAPFVATIYDYAPQLNAAARLLQHYKKEAHDRRKINAWRHDTPYVPSYEEIEAARAPFLASCTVILETFLEYKVAAVRDKAQELLHAATTKEAAAAAQATIDDLVTPGLRLSRYDRAMGLGKA
ncbi:MAG TPA: hypothetical protein VLF60_05500 [Candidatus Saccharimonadales bacterium]|nr:hypothetical protein [Candidatus Saccharimonadales bacterium]